MQKDKFGSAYSSVNFHIRNLLKDIKIYIIYQYMVCIYICSVLYVLGLFVC